MISFPGTSSRRSALEGFRLDVRWDVKDGWIWVGSCDVGWSYDLELFLEQKMKHRLIQFLW